MAVKIRLKRHGRKKHPTYRVVVTDERAKRDGRVIEAIGSYDPHAPKDVVTVDRDRATHWMAKGALPTRTVAEILKRQAKGK